MAMGVIGLTSIAFITHKLHNHKGSSPRYNENKNQDGKVGAAVRVNVHSNDVIMAASSSRKHKSVDGTNEVLTKDLRDDDVLMREQLIRQKPNRHSKNLNLLDSEDKAAGKLISNLHFLKTTGELIPTKRKILSFRASETMAQALNSTVTANKIKILTGKNIRKKHSSISSTNSPIPQPSNSVLKDMHIKRYSISTTRASSFASISRQTQAIAYKNAVTASRTKEIASTSVSFPTLESLPHVSNKKKNMSHTRKKSLALKDPTLMQKNLNVISNRNTLVESNKTRNLSIVSVKPSFLEQKRLTVKSNKITSPVTNKANSISYSLEKSPMLFKEKRLSVELNNIRVVNETKKVVHSLKKPANKSKLPTTKAKGSTPSMLIKTKNLSERSSVLKQSRLNLKSNMNTVFNLTKVGPKNISKNLTRTNFLNLIQLRSNSPACGKRVFLRIIVFSSPKNFLHRSAIRGTWGNTNFIQQVQSKLHAKSFSGHRKANQTYSDLVRVVFVIGKSNDQVIEYLVQSEANTFQDIVQGNFLDEYYHLSLKTILGLTWADKFCPGSYLMKTDDDVFVNLRELTPWLYDRPEERFYGGQCYRYKLADRSGKW